VTRGLAVALTAIAGGLVALQAPINSRLGKAVGTLQGASVSFLIGLIALTLLAATVGGGFGRLGHVRHLPLVYLVGGLLGAVYVSTVLVTVRTLGAGPVTAATITGQLAMALVVDQLGILGVARHPITAAKLIGVVLLGVGTLLIVRD